MKRTALMFCMIFGMGAAHAQLREGAHNLTLQWVGWDKPGKAQVHKNTDGTYSIEGEQKGKDGFVTIKGTLKQGASDKELIFDGDIKTMEKTINNGQVCEKHGTYHFLAKDKRKYWRLQEMDNCEGNNVVDYVDIYF
jgi:hypothetical protein